MSKNLPKDLYEAESMIYKTLMNYLITPNINRFMSIQLKFEETKKVFDPKSVYGNAPNPTQL